MPFDTVLIVLVLLLLVIAGLAAWIAVLERRINRLLAGRKANTLEDTIVNLHDGLVALGDAFERADKRFGKIENQMKKQISHVKTVRFNPFTEQGSNQSFATALLNDEGDGVVISSLYARDKVGIYCKPIRSKKSEFDLTAEERKVLD